jgi:hypothetical protein
MLGLHFPFLFLLLVGASECLQSFSDGNNKQALYTNESVKSRCCNDSSSARRVLLRCVGASVISLVVFPEISDAKSYSANARNLERMNTGDMSGGSLYDNYPKSAAGQRRRAMTGCKSAIAREEASEAILRIQSLSEKDCNQMVLEESPDFMLRSLRHLDCPSCPYGIATTRKPS